MKRKFEYYRCPGADCDDLVKYDPNIGAARLLLGASAFALGPLAGIGGINRAYERELAAVRPGAAARRRYHRRKRLRVNAERSEPNGSVYAEWRRW